MTVYITIVVLCILGDLIDRGSKKQKSKHTMYLYWLFLIFVALVIGFRSLTVGHDSKTYEIMYRMTNLYDNIFRMLLEKPLGQEYGFLVLSWLVGRVSTKVSLLFLISALFYVPAFGYWVWKKTKHPFIGMLVFICVFFTFLLTGLRQTIALAIVLLASLDLDKKKYVRFIFGVAVAMLFHFSAIFFLAHLFLRKNVSRGKYFAAMIVSFLILFPLRNIVFGQIINWISNTRYGDYTILIHGAPITYISMLILMGLVCVYTLPKTRTEAIEELNINFSSVMTAIPIMAFVTVNGSIMRVAMYFSVYMSILIPEIFEQFTIRNTRIILRYVTCLILIFLFLRNLGSGTVYEYEFIGWDTVKNLLNGGF